MKKGFYIFSFLLCLNLHAQNDFKQLELDLAYHADGFMNHVKPENRIRAHENFTKALQATLALEGSYDYPFDSLVWLSKLQPKDASFKIVTWQVELQENEFHYHGFIQFKDNESQAIFLNYTEDKSNVFKYANAKPEDWIGAYYYQLKKVDKKGKQYVLIGKQNSDAFTTRKIAEVLNVDAKNYTVSFGSPIFLKETNSNKADVQNRIIHSYSSDVMGTMAFDEEMDLLVFDHTIAVMGRMPGQGPTSVPDGSFVAYKPKGDKWYYQEKVFNQTSETPPGANTNKKEQLDIFGKERKSKGGN